MLCRHYIVEGQVQGVFFRASAQDVANNIGVKGWVRNLANGSVEVVACGTEQQLATLETWLNNGPPMAVVNRLKKADWEPTATFTEFKIR